MVILIMPVYHYIQSRILVNDMYDLPAIGPPPEAIQQGLLAESSYTLIGSFEVIDSVRDTVPDLRFEDRKLQQFEINR